MKNKKSTNERLNYLIIEAICDLDCAIVDAGATESLLSAYTKLVVRVTEIIQELDTNRLKETK